MGGPSRSNFFRLPAPALLCGLCVLILPVSGRTQDYSFETILLRVNESDGQVEICVERTGSLANRIDALVSTFDDTATSSFAAGGIDYLPWTNAPFQFPSGVARTCAPVMIVDDIVSESSESFIARIVHVYPPGELVFPDQVRVTIEDELLNEFPLEMSGEPDSWGGTDHLDYEIRVTNTSSIARPGLLRFEGSIFGEPNLQSAACVEANAGWSRNGASLERAITVEPGIETLVHACQSTEIGAPEFFAITASVTAEPLENPFTSSAGVNTPYESESCAEVLTPACCVSEFIGCAFDPGCGSPATPGGGLLDIGVGGVLRLVDSFFEAASDLELLYRVRDRLRRDPAARSAVDLYYEQSQNLKTAMIGQPALIGSTAELLELWRPVLEAYAEGSDQFSVSPLKLDALLEYLQALQAAANPQLAAVIARERAAIGVESLAGVSVAELMTRLGRLTCVPGPETQCLNDGRFRVKVDYATAAGPSGRGDAVPLTDESGYFWFFDDANVELVVKAVDACGLAGFENFWIFATGLTNVDVTMSVVDTATGLSKVYRNDLDQAFQPILDTGDFHVCGAASTASGRARARTAGPPAAAVSAASAGDCVASDTTLCLLGGRFEVAIDWATALPSSGAGRAVPLTDESGYFWFFDDANVELVIKVIDGCGFNDRFWVFAGGLTNVGTHLVVRDTRNPLLPFVRDTALGETFPPILSIDAFATCP